MEVPIEFRPDGTVVVPLHVQPGARRAAVLGVHGGAVKVAVTAPAERGRANDALVALLADVLGVPKRDVTVISGHTGRAKRVAVRGLDPASVRNRLAGVYRPRLP